MTSKSVDLPHLRSVVLAGHAGAGGASGTSDAAFAAVGLGALASLVLHSVDDELPSSPVYDTDTTPD